MLDQPSHRPVAVIHRAFPEPEVLTDLGLVGTSSALRPHLGRKVARIDTDLSGNKIHHVTVEVAISNREAPMTTIELQHQSKPQPRRATLARHKIRLTPNQSPISYEFVKIKNCFHEQPASRTHAEARLPLTTRFLPTG